MYVLDDAANFTNKTLPVCLLIPETLSSQIAKTVAYVIIIVCSLIGNAFVVYIVWQSIRLRTVINFFICNLAVSDILVAALCEPNMITQLFLGNKWIFGTVLCKLIVFFQSVTIASSVFTLLAISGDRYLAIVFPLRRRLSFTKAKIIVAVIWTVSIVMMAPLIYAQRVKTAIQGDYDVCIEEWSPVFEKEKAPRDFTVVLFVTMYVVPLITMGVLYFIICLKLWQRKLPGEKSSRSDVKIQAGRKKIVKMLMTIIVIFALCWLPLWLFQFLIFFSRDKYPCIAFNRTFYFLALFLGHSNSAINPFLYALLNKNFRQGFKQACSCLKARKYETSLPTSARPSLLKRYRSEQSLASSRNSLAYSPNKKSNFTQKTLSCFVLQRNDDSNTMTTGISYNRRSSTTSETFRRD